MKILLCHNHYQQRGGEDQSFEDEARLLESRGHQVLRFTIHNDAVKGMGRLRLAAKTFWNGETYDDLRQLLRAERPEVMHCTNTFPLISPAAYYAARAEGVAVVQSLRNYRLLCPNALLLREGKACEDCLGRKVAWPALLHGCYRGDRAATAVVTLMVGAHRAAGTWNDAVDLYFTPSEFARRKFIEGGFPADRIAVKPNFVFPDPRAGDGSAGGAIYVGRLSDEKGIDTLLSAWVQHGAGAMPLKIVGDGPMAPQVRAACAASDRIEWVGRLPVLEAMEHIGRASLLLFPSVAYETFGRTVVEAYAKGTPVLSSDAGAAAELIEPGRTGLLFRAGDAADLAAKVRELAANPAELAAMRPLARQKYLDTYDASSNYDAMMNIYDRAIRSRPRAAGAGAAAGAGDQATTPRSASRRPISLPVVDQDQPAVVPAVPGTGSR